ncbi:YrdB family protein [Fructilactobacillus sanfranciscensis]|uniref:YrdB family protein n=1 Tax=Fructilactobacillus sanfranciscensis TaxID=1625 RepID=UPI0013D85EE2|nr:YrdB family protein [Fructilactobacillus sanfranciscensis]MDN4462777.1 DUF2568 domain-containing protein [Fructilactobacillus sanfranciscensis]NDR61682.1 DUF2568 domain-containing protein [Fructilactobacillus sanfranciscensis]
MLKSLNDVVRFLVCEVFTLCLIVKAGMNLHSLMISFVLPVLTFIFWGVLMAPKSQRRLNEVGRIVSEVIIFGGTGILTYLWISKTVGIVYLAIALINTILDHILVSNEER